MSKDSSGKTYKKKRNRQKLPEKVRESLIKAP